MLATSNIIGSRSVWTRLSGYLVCLQGGLYHLCHLYHLCRLCPLYRSGSSYMFLAL